MRGYITLDDVVMSTERGDRKGIIGIVEKVMDRTVTIKYADGKTKTVPIGKVKPAKNK